MNIDIAVVMFAGFWEKYCHVDRFVLAGEVSDVVRNSMVTALLDRSVYCLLINIQL